MESLMMMKSVSAAARMREVMAVAAGYVIAAVMVRGAAAVVRAALGMGRVMAMSAAMTEMLEAMTNAAAAAVPEAEAWERCRWCPRSSAAQPLVRRWRRR